MEQTSIQEFYSREVKGSSNVDHSESLSSVSAGDGFTTDEVESYLNPQGLGPWQPQKEYEDANIGDLQAGSSRVMITGRVVNFHEVVTKGAYHPRPNGFVKMLVKDDTGIVSVKLWYAKVKFDIFLGQLVSVWTIHINICEPNNISLGNKYLHINLFPEGDRTCYFSVSNIDANSSLCRFPLGYESGYTIPGFMTLKDYFDGGHELNNAKLLLCIRSIGQRKKVTIKKGTPAEKESDRLEVFLFDDTHAGTLTLWNHLCGSAQHWHPQTTILLLTAPVLRPDTPKSHPQLSLAPSSLVEVDPALPDADWLREHARAKSKREHVNPPFPEGAFDIEAAKSAEVRVLFRFADIDEWVRAASEETVLGFFSVVVMELNLVKMQQRGMLCCGECCNVPVYANTVQASCKHCDTPLVLRLNPRIIGPLADETGSVATGKLILSDDAWEQLMGRDAEELVGEPLAKLKALEHRMLFLRLTMLMGWKSDVGRLVVLEVSSA